jgi:hypothetical protein
VLFSFVFGLVCGLLIIGPFYFALVLLRGFARTEIWRELRRYQWVDRVLATFWLCAIGASVAMCALVGHRVRIELETMLDTYTSLPWRILGFAIGFGVPGVVLRLRLRSLRL